RTFDELVETVSNSQPPPLAALPNGAIIRPKLRRRELEAVVHQALAKDPGRRQSSADAMADELQRLVEGEPVQALPQSLAYLLRKRFQQHRGSWLFAVVAALLLVFLAGGWFLTRRQTEQREEIARSFAQEAERIEWFLRYAQSLPLHDIRRERNLMKGRLARLEGQMEAFGPLAEGPGNFALGRGYAQLGDHERALESLETAWNSGFRTSGAALALGKVLGKLYAQRLEETLRLKDPQLRESRRRELQERYRNRALEFLRQSGSNELESPSYLSGLIAYYDDRLEEATRRAAQAQQEAPWLPDGFLLEGDAALALAIGHGEKGEYAEAEARFSQAFEAFGRAQEMTPSDPVPYESACEAWLHFIDMARLRGGDLTPGYSTGKRDCSLALEAEPDRPSCLLKIALLSIFRLQDPQLDPTEVETLLADAQRNAEAAKALLPSQGEVYQTLGTAHLSRALLVDVRQGLDPSPDLEQAAVAYRQAIRLDPALLTSHSNLGTVLAVSGGLLMNRGEDPRPLFDEAIGSYRQALARGPGRVALLNNLGNLHRDKAAYLIQRGLDPKAVLEAGLDACQEALAVNPRMVPALNLRGALEETLGQLAADRGEDPAPFFGRSIASLEAALGENPGYFRAAVNLGSTHLARARERAARGEDPRPALAEAFEALDL
ncbi:MAG: hypothetical protein KDD47_02055, partial [Acidobacteria bacterium]|nr:hypothetical protein [Acidobacteriota bacterium]